MDERTPWQSDTFASAYRRTDCSDKRRLLMEQWASVCCAEQGV
jgi:hypothetical protein